MIEFEKSKIYQKISILRRRTMKELWHLSYPPIMVDYTTACYGSRQSGLQLC